MILKYLEKLDQEPEETKSQELKVINSTIPQTAFRASLIKM